MEEERMEFVQRVMHKEKSKSALCREYGISRVTGDKWIKIRQHKATQGQHKGTVLLC